MPETPNLNTLFSPKSIAVVGMSQDSTKLGSVIYQNIRSTGFKGPVYPINPNHTEINGIKVYSKVSDVESDVELAVIAIPAKAIAEVIRDCVAKKVKNAVIISAGFSEVGEEGKKLENEIIEIARAGGIRILGPNCLGITVPGSKLDASFAAQTPSDGNIAFLSQSGAFNTALLDLAAEQGVGFSHFVSLGNKADLTEMDFLKNWLEEDKVKVIGMYLEEFTDGKELVDMIYQSSKPAVVLNPGKSKQAQSAISSHTGSLAGSSEVIAAALKKAGAIQVNSIEKMFNTLMTFSWSRRISGNRIAVTTNAGGPGIIVTDMISTAGLTIPEFSDALKQQLAEVLPATASTQNPIDLIGDALADRYISTLDILSKSNEIDAILVLLTPQHVTQIEETAKAIIRAAGQTNKPILPVFLGGEEVQTGLRKLFQAKVPAFQFAEEAVFALQQLVKFSNHQAKEHFLIQPAVQRSKNLSHFIGKEAKALPQNIVHELLLDLEVDIVPEQVVSSFSQAINFTSEFDFPVVLKAKTEDIAHKTDVKALYLDIKNPEELQEAFVSLQENVSQITSIEEPSLLIQQQIKDGEELIIGANRDGTSKVYEPDEGGFGHILVFGKGGIYTEVYEDVATGLMPLMRQEMKELIAETKVFEIMRGARGETPLAIDRLLDTLEAVQKLVFQHPEIESLDLNPVILTENRCVVVDAKVFVKE